MGRSVRVRPGAWGHRAVIESARYPWVELGVVIAQGAPRPRRSTGREGRGQSLTEFALVIPILLFVLLTIGDFGRFFATGITIESTARTAAEVAAQEYLAEVEAGVVLPDYDYALIHRAAWQSVCDETRGQPNMTPSSGGAQCDGIPTMVCVHDTNDPTCGTVYNDASGVPAGCSSFSGGTPGTTKDGQSHVYVEVRVCYRFSTLLKVDLPFIGGVLSPLSGDYYIERTRTFTVADY